MNIMAIVEIIIMFGVVINCYVNVKKYLEDKNGR
jgi:hypothetical protein